MSSATVSPTSRGIVRASTTERPGTSYTMPPLLQMASPWSPTWCQSGSIHRIGRPVTNTTVTP
jgi:hypothetical protein